MSQQNTWALQWSMSRLAPLTSVIWLGLLFGLDIVVKRTVGDINPGTIIRAVLAANEIHIVAALLLGGIDGHVNKFLLREHWSVLLDCSCSSSEKHSGDEQHGEFDYY